MKRLNRLAIVTGMLLALGIAACAQAPNNAGQQRQRGQRAQLTLAVIPPEVMNSITPLKGDQKSKITAIQDKFKADVTAARGTAGAGGADREKMRELSTKASDDVKAVLTPNQASAIETAAPALALLRSTRTVSMNAVPELKLTPDQWTQIEAVASDVRTKAQGVPREQRRDKMRELNADAKTRIDAILTPQQKAIAAKHPVETGRRGNTATNNNGSP
jgi:Spy/CpxP family protein refolding chaperone